jgi:hypothetical protein
MAEGINNSFYGADEADAYQGKAEGINNSVYGADEADAYQGKAEGINNSVDGADEADLSRYGGRDKQLCRRRRRSQRL